MNFRLFIEIAEPKRPTNVVPFQNKDSARQDYIRYTFTTNSGNSVKIIFMPTGDKKYEVMFYVNDSMLDDATGSRDIDLLGNVAQVIKDKADELGAEEIEFNTVKDSKIVKKLDVKKSSNDLINICLLMKNNPLANKFISREMDKIIDKVNKMEIILIEYWHLQYNDLMKRIEDYNHKVKSNIIPRGVVSNKNRRNVIYLKIINRFFKDFDVEYNGQDYIRIIRKKA